MTATLTAGQPPDVAAAPAPRRGRRLAGLAFLVLAMGVSAWVWWSFYALRIEQTYRVVETGGAVEIDSPGAAEGTRIVTGDDGGATVEVADGTTVGLLRGSMLVIGRARTSANGRRSAVEMKLHRGEATTSVPHDDGVTRAVELSTDVVAIGVRGTVFTTAADEDGARVTVSRGRVEAHSSVGEGVEIGAGFGTVILPGRPPEPPSRLLDAPIPRGPVADVRIADLTFTWDAVADAVRYDLQVDDSARFSSPERHRRVSGTRARLEPLARDGRYYWRVAPVDTRGLRGAWSPGRRFEQVTHYEDGRRALLDLSVDDAVASFDAAGRDFDAVLEQLRDRARANAAAGRLERARAELAVVHRLRPADDGVLVELGELDFALGAHDDARSRFQTVLARQPREPRAAIGMARLHFLDARFDASLENAVTALEQEPENTQALELAALAAVNTGALDEARHTIDRLAETDPENATARVLRETLDRRSQIEALFGALRGSATD